MYVRSTDLGGAESMSSIASSAALALGGEDGIRGSRQQPPAQFGSHSGTEPYLVRHRGVLRPTGRSAGSRLAPAQQPSPNACDSLERGRWPQRGSTFATATQQRQSIEPAAA